MIDVLGYDPLKVILTFGGVAITGYADGAMIEVEKNEDNAKPYVGTQGDVAFAESADRTGKIKINLMQTSPSVKYLNDCAKKKGDEASLPVSIVDMNTNGTNCSGTKARVIKESKVTYDKEVKEHEFEIYVADLTIE
jgi:hypothetical protein